MNHDTLLSYELNGKKVSAQEFVDTACNPHYSVVIKACAGSGKTWLLVSRMLRLLLVGVSPSALLAITFTRKAAQEMQTRLMELLKDCALLPEEKVIQLLLERGVEQSNVRQQLLIARTLYERVLSSFIPLSIDTFHSWFIRLIQIAPLSSLVPHGYGLLEESATLLEEAYHLFIQSLNEDKNVKIKSAMIVLYEQVGDVKKLLNSFIAKRAEWWASGCNQEKEPMPLVWLKEMGGIDMQIDARFSLWEDENFKRDLYEMASVFGKGTNTQIEYANQIEKGITLGASIDNFEKIKSCFFTSQGETRKYNPTKGSIKKSIDAKWGEVGVDIFETQIEKIVLKLSSLEKRSEELNVYAINQAMFIAGEFYLTIYQNIKSQQRVFDFTDLEWYAFRLLSHPHYASYLHTRLDTRYQHILFDEFQDTNPMQWHIVEGWLSAYGSEAERPRVFIVGDPKQSIYRFRRADSRLFSYACDLLAEQGAFVLETNQTRRNAKSIVKAVNQGMQRNSRFAHQCTYSDQDGAVWCLPLIESKKLEKEKNELTFRHPLFTPEVEEEDVRRYEEGVLVAKAIRLALSQLKGKLEKNRTPRWSDVMLLVKRRTHLSAYEMALRQAGVPYVSDRRGGLLESLEVLDLIALLTVLMSPVNDVACAHVLRSPLFGFTDEDLIALNQCEEKTWWEKLNVFAREIENHKMLRAFKLLSQWREIATYLPVHDLLDKILYEGEFVERYVAAVPNNLRIQMVANIEAFIELSLSLEAGRYPSVQKFIDALKELQKGKQQDAPDEALVDVDVDAVQILTVHAAKGLEAAVVIVLDSNSFKPPDESYDILCSWPVGESIPQHFSVYGKKSQRGCARDKFFLEEEKLKEEENWNLLYVALTRAKNILILSGVADNKKENGIGEDSWYGRMYQKEYEMSLSDLNSLMITKEGSYRSEEHVQLSAFFPLDLSLTLNEPEEVEPLLVIEEGIVLHALLERITVLPVWPITVPEPDLVKDWLTCSYELAKWACSQVKIILSQEGLRCFFDYQLYDVAHNEMEIIEGELLHRLDRVVVFEKEVWIIDYKRQFLKSEQDAYQSQLARYRNALEKVFMNKVIRTALILFSGELIKIGEENDVF